MLKKANRRFSAEQSRKLNKRGQKENIYATVQIWNRWKSWILQATYLLTWGYDNNPSTHRWQGWLVVWNHFLQLKTTSIHPERQEGVSGKEHPPLALCPVVFSLFNWIRWSFSVSSCKLFKPLTIPAASVSIYCFWILVLMQILGQYPAFCEGIQLYLLKQLQYFPFSSGNSLSNITLGCICLFYDPITFILLVIPWSNNESYWTKESRRCFVTLKIKLFSFRYILKSLTVSYQLKQTNNKTQTTNPNQKPQQNPLKYE